MADLIAGTITAQGPGYLVVTEIGTGIEHRIEVKPPMIHTLATQRLEAARSEQTESDVAIMSGDMERVRSLWEHDFAYLAVAPEEPEDAFTKAEYEYVIALVAAYLRSREMNHG